MSRLTPLLVIAALIGTSMALAGGPLSARAATLSGAGDWPMYLDGPAHNAVNRAETTLSPTTVAGLHVTDTHPNWNPIQSPIIVGSLAYVSSKDGRYIRAYHLPSGTLAWEQQVNGRWSPAVSHGVAFVGGNGAMYAFNAATGQQLWKTTGSPAGAFVQVTVSGSTVYADTLSGTVYAFDGATGRILWSAIAPGCCLNGPVTVAGGLAYVVTDHLVAYNATTGVPVFSSISAPSDSVAVSHGVAYVPSYFVLEAFNASTGAALWSSQLGTQADSPLAAGVDGGTLVVGTTRYLMAFDANTGGRLWTLDGGSDRTFYSAPAIANGVVYAATSNGLQVVDETTGRLLYAASGPPCSGVVVSHGSVYLSCLQSLGAGWHGPMVFGL